MSILMLILIAADIWAIYNVVESDVNGLAKLLWAILIVAMPVFGLIIWYLLGPKGPAEALVKRQAEPSEPEPKPSEPEPVSDDPSQNDLKRITGIGTVFAGRLNNAGIFTFAQLAEMTQEEITEIVFVGDTVRSYDIAEWIVKARQLAKSDEATNEGTQVAQSDKQTAATA